MIRFIMRGILLPILYLLSMIKLLIRFAAYPVVFVISLFLKSWYILAAGILAGLYLTPIATVVICIVALFYAAGKAGEMTSDFLHYRLKVRWGHVQKLRTDYGEYSQAKRLEKEERRREKTRIKQERMAIKGYDKHADEFVGFDIISDIYTL